MSTFPDFYYDNSSMIRFSSYDALTEYVNQMLDKPMYGETSTFTSWLDAFDKYFDKDVIVKHVDMFGNEYYEMPEIVSESHTSNWLSQGDTISVSSSTQAAQASQASSVGGGGAKAPAKVQTIVTDTTTGGATPGETAKGLKNFGLPTQNELANLVDGLCKAMGIANLAINAQNLGLYREFCNYVFDAGMPETVTVDQVKNFLFSTTQTIVTRDENDKIITVVPESIARKMYDFFKDHITQTGGEGAVQLNIPDLGFSLVVWGQLPDTSPYYERYLQCITNVAPNTGTYYAHYAKPSDQMLQLMANDFCNVLTGAGYNVPTVITESLVLSMEGLFDKFFENSSVRTLFGTLDNVPLITVSFGLSRGGSAPPKTTPIALSEIYMGVSFIDVDMHIDTTLGEDDPRVETHFNVNDMGKYLKRGKTGEYASDYGYHPRLTYYDEPDADGYKYANFNITYPSNVQSISVYNLGRIHNFNTLFSQAKIPMNGMVTYDDTETWPDSGSPNLLYSNLGYTGQGTNYEFDEYLSAGFVKRTWDVPEAPDKLPTPNTTIDTGFQDWMHKKKTLSQPDLEGNEIQISYVPVNIGHGEDNAKNIVNNGGNSSPSTNRSQQYNQTGEIDPNINIDDFNKEIEKPIQKINESRYTPEYAPDPIPINYPNPQYPTNPPTEPGGDSGDTPTPSAMETVTASGMVSVYNPTKQQLIDFSAWLWSPNFLDNFLKIFANPMDAIIGLHILYATPSTGNSEHIVAGYLDSGVSSKVVNNQFTEIDCGTVIVPEYYGNVLDYEPYVQIHVYLPFVGIQALKPNDVIGKQLNIKYGVDALTGTCLATLTTKKGDSEIACYNFAGNCATQVPVSGGNYSQMITGLASMAVGVGGAIATGNPIMLAGAAVGAMNSHLDVSHSGSIGANAGAMGIRKPYLIITRKAAYEAAGYGSFYGFPANKSVILSACTGYTRVKSVHIETIPVATDNEKTEIETLLKQGVIIK